MNTTEENAFTQNILPIIDKYLKAHTHPSLEFKGMGTLRNQKMGYVMSTVFCFQIYFFSLSFRNIIIFDLVFYSILPLVLSLEESDGLQREKKCTNWGSKTLQE